MRVLMKNFLIHCSVFDLIESSSTKVSMQALRLLINLSTNEHMIQYLHSANVSTNFEKTTKNPDFEEKKFYLHMIACFFKV